MKHISHIILIFTSILWANDIVAQMPQRIPLTERVNIQMDSARTTQIIDGQWVAVGTNKTHTIQKDFGILFDGKPSYRFELKKEDNTLSGYSKGETKGRAELSYCYATHSDFSKLPDSVYQNAQKMKTVYHYGKGSCSQGASMSYTFSIFVPQSLSPNVSTIFAQWHGMPSRTLVSDPNGKIMRLSTEEFLRLDSLMIFKKTSDTIKSKGLTRKGKQYIKPDSPMVG